MSDLDLFKTIAIDLDGPLYQFERTMRYMLREERGCSWLTKPSTDWDYVEQRVSPEDWKWLWNEAVEQGLFRHGHVTKHAIRAVRALKDAGYDLKVLTHRPHKSARAQLDTHRWLDFHFGPRAFSDIIVTDRPKEEFKGAFLLIDDKPENIEGWRKSSRPAYLFAEPWNEGNDRFRFDGWYPILDHLRVSR